MAMGARMASTEIPQLLQEKVMPEFGIWHPPVLLDQAWVDDYTWVTRDTNPVHRPDWVSPLFPKPIVPGLMLLASADCFFEGGVRKVFHPWTVLLREVLRFKPKRAVQIGLQVQLRYRVPAIAADIGGIYADVEIEFRTAFPQKAVMSGALSFYLRDERP